MKSSSSSDGDYSLWRHSRKLINLHHIICIFNIWNISLTSLPVFFFFVFQVWDQGHTSCGGECSGEPKGESQFPQFQATTLQHAGILRPHRSRHQWHAALLPLSRHRVQTRGLQSGELSPEDHSYRTNLLICFATCQQILLSPKTKMVWVLSQISLFSKNCHETAALVHIVPEKDSAHL